MNKKVDNAFVPKFVPKNLKWNKQDGLLTWYDQTECEKFLEDLDAHFQKLQIVNIDIINSKGNLDPYKLKQYQTVKHSEILTYPQEQQGKILSSIVRTKRDGMFVKKETINEHFKKPIKSYGCGSFIKKIVIYIIRIFGSIIIFLFLCVVN